MRGRSCTPHYKTVFMEKGNEKIHRELVMHFKADLGGCKTWISATSFEESTKYNR